MMNKVTTAALRKFLPDTPAGRDRLLCAVETDNIYRAFDLGPGYEDAARRARDIEKFTTYLIGFKDGVAEVAAIVKALS